MVRTPAYLPRPRAVQEQVLGEESELMSSPGTLLETCSRVWSGEPPCGGLDLSDLTGISGLGYRNTRMRVRDAAGPWGDGKADCGNQRGGSWMAGKPPGPAL